MDFKDKIAVITGSERGIGYTTAKLMIEKGASVIGVDLKESNGTSLNPDKYEYIKADISDVNEIDALFSQIGSKYEKIDILLNCAGIASLDGVMDITSELWDKMLDVNLKSVFFCSQYALKTMIKQGTGKIVNVSSIAGECGGKVVGANYSASKAGVISLTKSLALYGADYNINVNCVAPGPTETPMTSVWGEKIHDILCYI